ncbi:MAG: serine/threonine-protein kinase [Verrucomicrobiales bacterium]
MTGLLGRGGMGAVYKGRQTHLDRAVAIKLLSETFTEGADELNFASRFKQEARAMASLDHPAIVSVHDFGETSEGQLYFVMEFIDGMDIHQYLHHHGGALLQDHALAIVCHVLDALDYAHERGIVHRDIKPANVLLNQEGQVKIADFGLAKTIAQAAGDELAAPALTLTNMAMGTPDYAAPEMLEIGTTPDHRVDLYAVGVMLYQLLTGKLPRGNFQTPSALQPALDPRLDEIVSKAMAADPDSRYTRASEIRTAIDEVLSQPTTRLESGAVKRKTAAAKRPASTGMWWGLGIGGVATMVAVALIVTDGDEPKASGEPGPLMATAEPKSAPKPVSVPRPEPEPELESKPEPEPSSQPALDPTSTPRPAPSEPSPEPAAEPEAATPVGPRPAG